MMMWQNVCDTPDWTCNGLQPIFSISSDMLNDTNVENNTNRRCISD
jgi:hypothetical protein